MKTFPNVFFSYQPNTNERFMCDTDIQFILEQLREGKTLQEPFSEKRHGEIRYYFFDLLEQHFYCRRIDSIVGSYSLLIKVSKEELRGTIEQIGFDELKLQGFRLN